MRLLAVWSLLAVSTLMGESIGAASRTLTLVPEEIVVKVLITTVTELTPEQAALALEPLGISQTNLENVGSRLDQPGRLSWQYTFVAPYSSLFLTLRQLDYTWRQAQKMGIPMSYDFFFRPAPKTLDAAKSQALTELIREARTNANATGKLVSVTIEPTPQTINSTRPTGSAGESSGAMTYQLNVVAVFE